MLYTFTLRDSSPIRSHGVFTTGMILEALLSDGTGNRSPRLPAALVCRREGPTDSPGPSVEDLKRIEVLDRHTEHTLFASRADGRLRTRTYLELDGA